MRIIGAEPAGDAVREVTGPVEEGHPELPHWNDAPTGQVPAILDRSNGEEQRVAPPTWREEDHDWEAQEDVFEPSMLSDDLPAVGALLSERPSQEDDARQPWHFESDDTLIIPPEPAFEPEIAEAPPELAPEEPIDTGPRRRVSSPRRARRHDAEPVWEPEPVAAAPEEAPPEAGEAPPEEPAAEAEFETRRRRRPQRALQRLARRVGGRGVAPQPAVAARAQGPHPAHVALDHPAHGERRHRWRQPGATCVPPSPSAWGSGRSAWPVSPPARWPR